MWTHAQACVCWSKYTTICISVGNFSIGHAHSYLLSLRFCTNGNQPSKLELHQCCQKVTTLKNPAFNRFLTDGIQMFESCRVCKWCSIQMASEYWTKIGTLGFDLRKKLFFWKSFVLMPKYLANLQIQIINFVPPS